MQSPLKIVTLAAIAALALAGCGVRGSLEPPPGATPDPTAKANSGMGKPEGSTGSPHKPFILDDLLR